MTGRWSATSSRTVTDLVGGPSRARTVARSIPARNPYTGWFAMRCPTSDGTDDVVGDAGRCRADRRRGWNHARDDLGTRTSTTATTHNAATASPTDPHTSAVRCPRMATR